MIKTQINNQIEMKYILKKNLPILNKNNNIKEDIHEVKPFVKWLGGKRQLLDSLSALLPTTFNNYHEPFVGGGALLFSLNPNVGTINDLNSELITTYKVIKKNHFLLIAKLEKMVIEHNQSIDSQAYYYSIREQNPNYLTDLEIAARFVYLNKIGFNGLYRTNKKGIFNVPFGKKETINNATIFSSNNIKAVSKMLNKNEVKLINKDFDYILQEAKKDDFVFIDSPYDDSWTGYQSGGFDEKEHRRLADVVKELNRRGIKFMLTNHNTALIRELYADFDFYEIPVNRNINTNSNNRANATTEVIIVNYAVTKEQVYDFNTSKFFKQLKSETFILNDLIDMDFIKNKEICRADKEILSKKWFFKKIKSLLRENNIEFKQDISYESVLNTGNNIDKTFDFVFTIAEKTYCVEADFFSTSRVKINSECDRLTDLNEVCSDYPDLEFIWLTDGIGLRNYKSKVTQTLKKIEKMFNLTLFEEFIS